MSQEKIHETVISTLNAPAAIGPYSQAIAVGKLLFTSGQIALHPETGEMVGSTIEEQTERVMLNLKGILAEAGVGLDRIIKTTCFLTDMQDFAAFNKIYGTFFLEGKPARSCVAVASLPKGAKVEVECIAML